MEQAIKNTEALLPDHFATLLGERPFGSTWGRDFTRDDFRLAWIEATTELPAEVKMDGCRYFKLSGAAFQKAFPDAELGAIPLGQLPVQYIGGVYVADGEHGRELRVHRPDPALIDDAMPKLERPTEAWIILGIEDGAEVVFTAHPGPVMTPYRDGSQLIAEAQHVAVKILP